MHVNLYIETLQNEGFGLVEEMNVLNQSDVVTTVQVTEDIAINLYTDNEGYVYGAGVFTSLLPSDHYHHIDSVKIIDVVTRLTANLSEEDRENIYQTITEDTLSTHRIQINGYRITYSILDTIMHYSVIAV